MPGRNCSARRTCRSCSRTCGRAAKRPSPAATMWWRNADADGSGNWRNGELESWRFEIRRQNSPTYEVTNSPTHQLTNWLEQCDGPDYYEIRPRAELLHARF